MVDFPGVVPSCGSLPPLSPPVTSNPSKKRTKALKDVFLESEDALEGLSVPAAGRPLWAVAEEGWEAGGEEHEFPPRNQPMSGVKRWVEDARKPQKKLGGGELRGWRSRGFSPVRWYLPGHRGNLLPTQYHSSRGTGSVRLFTLEESRSLGRGLRPPSFSSGSGPFVSCSSSRYPRSRASEEGVHRFDTGVTTPESLHPVSSYT